MILSQGWSPGGQLYLEGGYYWGITGKLNTVAVGTKEQVEKWLNEKYQHPNNVIANILMLERSAR